jgi:hypothetical protein
MVQINNKKLADIGFYINLDSRTDRKEQLLKNLQEFNITGVERYSAKQDDPTAGINLINTTLEIYKRFLDSNAETLLILEDDCKFLEPLNKESDKILSDIYSTDWDIFWLGCFNRRKPIFYKNNCYQVSSVSYAQSYIITRKIAEESLQWKTHYGFGHIDEFLCLYVYSTEIAVDPNGVNFYEKVQPLDSFKTTFKALTYKYALSTQYNSYSDLWGFETCLCEYVQSSHPEKYNQ